MAAADDSTNGYMTSTDHTTLTSLSGFASGIAPTTPAGVLWLANKTGVDLKTNATTDIFTVPAGKTAAALNAWVIPTAVTAGAAVTFKYQIVESGGGAGMTDSLQASSAAPVTTKNWTQRGANLGGIGPSTVCAAGAKVRIAITAAFTTSTTVTGTVWVAGFYF